MTERVRLQLPPDEANVGLARLVVVTAARDAGMHAERLEDLRLVVSEAVTNAVISHQRAQNPHPVTLAVDLADDGSFEVIVTDEGPGFEPPPPEDGEARDWSIEGGLGLSLMRTLADDAAFERDEAMHVRLRFAPEARVS